MGNPWEEKMWLVEKYYADHGEWIFQLIMLWMAFGLPDGFPNRLSVTTVEKQKVFDLLAREAP
jgi:hypothetical protein